MTYNIVIGGRMLFCPDEAIVENIPSGRKKRTNSACPVEQPKSVPVNGNGIRWGISNGKKSKSFDHHLVVRYPRIEKTMAQIEGIEYEVLCEDKVMKGIAYEVNDVWSVTGIHPETLLAYVNCWKIYGFWSGVDLFIDMKTLEKFHRRCHNQ
ncbi:MAG: hypothetical protein PHH21_03585 [Candidatus Pacebacteria bacterium]|nr:hypothetical protein [Candidatus Paceibacterota bacterium]